MDDIIDPDDDDESYVSAMESVGYVKVSGYVHGCVGCSINTDAKVSTGKTCAASGIATRYKCQGIIWKDPKGLGQEFFVRHLKAAINIRSAHL